MQMQESFYWKLPDGTYAIKCNGLWYKQMKSFPELTLNSGFAYLKDLIRVMEGNNG